jgi:hypothetical protein
LKTFGYEEIGRKRIGNVEGKVANHGEFGRSEVVESSEVSDKNSIGLGVLDQTKKPGLSGFLDSWGGKVDGNL